MRAFLVAFFRIAVRLFYRRLEILGAENVPAKRGVVYAVNHPNGLVDPLFVLCYAPSPVSFLAKAPLFRYPVIGWFARKLDSIPVYRRQDDSGGSNAETFARARSILARGGSVAIFPEGTTHSDPQLRDLKTGAARIALGIAGGTSGAAPVIIPTGIYYAAKQTFRSDALVVFGAPIDVNAAPLGDDGEPEMESVRKLTDAIDEGLSAVTVQADSRAALELVNLAEELFSAADPPSVSSEFTLRRRFVDGYHFLRERQPERLARLESAITRFAAELGEARLEPHELLPRFRAGSVIRGTLLFPFAVAGGVLNYPTYRLIGFLSKRFARGESEMMATMKFVGALFLFPLTWIVYAWMVSRRYGTPAGLVVLLAVPTLGYVALRVFERLDVYAGRLRALARGDRRRRLLTERDAIIAEIMAVWGEMRGGSEQ